MFCGSREPRLRSWRIRLHRPRCSDDMSYAACIVHGRIEKTYTPHIICHGYLCEDEKTKKKKKPNKQQKYASHVYFPSYPSPFGSLLFFRDVSSADTRRVATWFQTKPYGSTWFRGVDWFSSVRIHDATASRQLLELHVGHGAHTVSRSRLTDRRHQKT